MRVRFWGTRGSVPTPGPGTVRYGGNTACLEVRGEDDRLIVLDAGTGIRGLGQLPDSDARSQRSGPRVDLFVTHAHWDHIQGLPFFAPLYDREATVAIWGPRTLTTPLEAVLEAMLAPAVFPVGFAQLAARLSFPQLDSAPVSAGLTRVTALPALHPGGAAGFRVEPDHSSGRAIVYFPDNEVRAQAGVVAPDEWRRRFLAFAAGARVLVHDAMYREAEYAHRHGWGHSTADDAIGLAIDAGIPELVLFHHDPDRTDDALDALLAEAREAADGRVEVRAAVEGAEFEV